jgi:hypothetical protein
MTISVFRFNSIVSKLIRFWSIIVFSVEDDLILIIEFVELFWSWIYLISIISRLSYDWRRLMTSIIRRFSWVILSLIRQSYIDLKLVHRTSEISIKILSNVVLITILISNSCIMSYSSIVSTLLIILLHLMNDQCMMLTTLVKSIKHMTYSIWDKRSLLLAKEESIKTINCNVSRLSRMIVELSKTHIEQPNSSH